MGKLLSCLCQTAISPKIVTVIPYLINAHWVLGNVQDALTIPAPKHIYRIMLAISTALCFSDHYGWHSSETKSVNSNSALDFFQESCKRNWMHFVCLAANYERTHNNEQWLDSTCKNIIVARGFHINSMPLILAMLLRVDVSIFPKIWVSERLRDLSKVNPPANGRARTHTQLYWLWFQWSTPTLPRY